MKSTRSIHTLRDISNDEALFSAILTLKNREESSAFLRNLFTPDEIRALANRWAVAQLERQSHSLGHSRSQILLNDEPDGCPYVSTPWISP